MVMVEVQLQLSSNKIKKTKDLTQVEMRVLINQSC